MAIPTEFNINKILGVPGLQGPPGTPGATGPQGPPGTSGGATYTLSGTSADLVAGDWVCTDPGILGGGTITKATTAAVLAAKNLLGVVDTAYTAGAVDVMVRTKGSVVAASVFTDLGAGDPSQLQLNSTARAIRNKQLSGGAIRCGTVDAAGNVTVNPKVSIDLATRSAYDPRTYGAVGNKVIDDIDALEAWLAAMPSVIDPGSGIESFDAGYAGEWPPGFMPYVSRSLVIDKCVSLVGSGGGNKRLSCGIISAPGVTPLILEHGIDNPSGTSASRCLIEGLTLRSKILRWGPTQNTGGIRTGRLTSTRYEMGNCVKAAANANKGYFFRVTAVSGTQQSSATAEGSLTGTGGRLFGTAIPGDVFVDGDITWTCEAAVTNRQDSRVMRVGDRYMNAGSNKLTAGAFGDDDNRYYYECTVAGTLGNSGNRPGTLDSPLIGATFTDGTATMMVKTHCGILAKTPSTIRRVNALEMTNAVVFLEGTSPNSVDNSIVENVIGHTLCGLGVALKGDDANGIRVYTVDSNTAGVDLSDHSTNNEDWETYTNLGGTTCYDHSQSGATWIACYGQGSDGRNITSRSIGGKGCFIGCFSETGLSDKASTGGCTRIATTNGTGQAIGDWVELGGVGQLGQGIVTRDLSTAGKFLQRQMTAKDGTTLDIVWSTSAGHDPAAKWRRAYEYNGTIQGGNGWYSWIYSGQYELPAYGFSGWNSTQGAGHWRDYRGHLCGAEADGASNITWKGYASTFRSRDIRRGFMLAGDQWETLTRVTPGRWRTQIASTTGVRGPASWIASHTYDRGDLSYTANVSTTTGNAVNPIVVTTSTPHTLRTGDSVTITGVVGNTAANTTATATFISNTQFSIPVTGNGAYTSGGLVSYTGTKSSGPPDQIEVNGRTFRVLYGSGAGATFSNSGLSATLNHDADFDAATTAGISTVTDGTVTWLYLGTIPTYVWTNFVDDPVIGYTSQAKVRWVDSADTDSATASPGAALDSQKHSGTTTNNTPLVIATYPLVNNGTTRVDAAIAAFQTAGTSSPDGASFTISGVFYRSGGGAPQTIKAFVVSDSSPNANGTAWTAVGSISGNNAIITVTGDTGKTVHWAAARQGLEAT